MNLVRVSTGYVPSIILIWSMSLARNHTFDPKPKPRREELAIATLW